jgi:hypothetical protein
MNHWTIDNLNYARDRRNCRPAAVPTIYDGEDVDGDPVYRDLPYRWEVCPVCEGRGSYVNPAIDCGGISRDDFDADPDFEESYRGGAYDMTCVHCQGRTTVPAIALDRLTQAQAEAWEAQQRGDDDVRAMELAEIRRGA